MNIMGPLYRVGDFVSCDYSSIMLFSYYDDEISSVYYYGIVVEVDYAYYEFMDEYVYEVLCLDGEKRFFMESELQRIA
tara:strand:- start:131 stop:364 length:234 start_codon:yes stop_codon:yes gene_type:complete